MRIEDLPDYPALQQLARALWRQGTARGAAAFVGAGFSKFADLAGADTPKPPIWSEFAHEMARQLYPRNANEAPRDPLRLAEEYRTYFGQAALDEFIRVRIRDDAWYPGTLHHALLELEWSDVLTTNWDTLLERAATIGSHRRYERVQCEADIAHAHAPGAPRYPRIIKLHGSLGTTDHFIVAEDDYRTYPVHFAVFVNLARQVFIENELCLLGFSGDDPNFLQWSGWVRDNLGGSARRIYLVGVLDLGPARRRLLEARNVTPIDLALLVGDGTVCERHAVAIRAFLDYLGQRQPKPAHDWTPTSLSKYDFLPKTMEDQRRAWQDTSYAATLLERSAAIWQIDRETYPGWLICPAGSRQTLRLVSGAIPVTQSTLDTLSSDRIGTILYEIAWRYTVAQWPVDNHLASLLATVAEQSSVNGLNKEQSLEIAVLLLRTARLADDDGAFTRWAHVIETHSALGDNNRAEVAYQIALRARDRLDLITMIGAIDAIDGPDPIWALRRAALRAEVGDFAQARNLVFEALAELDRRQRSDPNSLWVRSRRAWAEWVARAMRQDQLLGREEARWPLEFRNARCDPKDEVDWIGSDAAAGLRKQREEAVSVIPLFEPGHYKDSSTTIHFRGTSVVEPMDALDLLMEKAGLPARLNHLAFVGTAARDAAQLSFTPSFRWYIRLLRVLDSPFDALFSRFFGRVAIAQLTPEVASSLYDSVTMVVSFWRDKVRTADKSEFLFAVGQLRLFIEVLARLTVRQDPVVAQASYAVAKELAGDTAIMHLWLYEPLGRLANYSIQAMPPASRVEVVLASLEFPLSPDGDERTFQWPNPIQSLWTTNPERREGDACWEQCVVRLIEAAKAQSAQRAEAVLRLAYLAKWNALTTNEATAFGQALWSSSGIDPSGFPAGTSLLVSTYAELPAPKGTDIVALVGTYLFASDISQILAPPIPLSSREIGSKAYHLLAISATSQGSLRPTAEQAARLFDGIVRWRPISTDGMDGMRAGLIRQLNEGTPRSLSYILRNIVVPSLAAQDRTPERARGLLEFIRDVPAGVAVGALPYFCGDQSGMQAEIIHGIQQAIVGRTEEDVSGGALAVETWALQGSACAGVAFPSQLADRVVSAVESGRETGLTMLLRCTRKLTVAGMLPEQTRSRASNALGDLLVEQNYGQIEPDSRRSVSVSLIRAECVRLAHALEDAGTSGVHSKAWLTVAEIDPLPEVRFALSATD